jgi:NitT/TauT family transport system ATP-binding protein
MIQIVNVEKVFYTKTGSVKALDGVTTEVRPMEFVSIVGPSGCGKSTLLRIVAGLIPPTKGMVMIDGKKVEQPVDNLGMVFQSPTLLRWRTVTENILLPIEVRKLNKRDYASKAMELIELTGLSGFEDKYPSQLSGGMQQRVAICRALITDPAILLMDEPFGALDALTREQMNYELLKIWESRRKTVMFVTHSVTEAVFLSDRVVVMSKRPGRIIDDIRVDMPRPRRRNDPRFLELVDRIHAKLGIEVPVSG